MELLENLKSIWGGVLMVVDRKRDMPNAKPQGQLCWSEASMVTVLESIRPYLKLKREQADILLELQANKMSAREGRRNGLSRKTVEQRESAYNRLKALNKRGRQIAV